MGKILGDICIHWAIFSPNHLVTVVEPHSRQPGVTDLHYWGCHRKHLDFSENIFLCTAVKQFSEVWENLQIIFPDLGSFFGNFISRIIRCVGYQPIRKLLLEYNRESADTVWRRKMVLDILFKNRQLSITNSVIDYF